MTDSTMISHQIIQQWKDALESGIEQAQIDALRQISSHESMTGLAAAIVLLSGDPREELRMWAAEAMESAVQPVPSEVAELISLTEQSAGEAAA